MTLGVNFQQSYARYGSYVMRGILCVTLGGQMVVVGFCGGCYYGVFSVTKGVGLPHS